MNGMKTIVSIAIGLMMIATIVPMMPNVKASDNDNIIITMNPGGTASITCTQSTWSPSVSIGGNAATAPDWGTVTNDGTVQVDVSVNATNTAAWTIGSSSANNQFQMQWGTGTGGGSPPPAEPVPASLILRPRADYIADWTKVGSGTYHYQVVDDPVADGTTTYLYNTMRQADELFNMQAHGTETGTITNITFYAVARENLAVGTAFNFWYLDGTESYSNSSESFVLTTSWETYSWVQPTDWNGDSWTWDVVDSILTGFEGQPQESTGPQITQYYMVVNYETLDNPVLLPSGDYTSSWTNVGAPTNYQCVSEKVPDNDASYVRCTYVSIGEPEMYSMPDMVRDGTINWVKVYVTARTTQSAGGDMQWGFSDQTDYAYNFSDIMVFSDTYETQSVTLSSMRDADTNAEIPWTWDILNNSIFLMHATGFYGTETEQFRVTQMYAEINYTASGGGGGVIWTNIGNSPSTFASSFANGASQDFGLQIFMPTSSSTNTVQTTIITFKATAN